MQQMVVPFANGSTTYDGILPATRRDTSFFGCYSVVDRLLRVTKRLDLRLVSSQKPTVSRPWLKHQQTLEWIVIITEDQLPRI